MPINYIEVINVRSIKNSSTYNLNYLFSLNFFKIILGRLQRLRCVVLLQFFCSFFIRSCTYIQVY
jgi:hypothetical protein